MKMMVFSSKLTSSLLVILMASLGLGAAMPRARTALPNKTLIYCSEASPIGFDPSNVGGAPEYTAAAALYNRLVEYKRDSIEKIEPSLAERWEISEDRRMYIFHLRG